MALHAYRLRRIGSVGLGLALAALSLGALASCGSSSTAGGGSTSGGRYASAPPRTIDTSKTYGATIVTSKGTIELALDAKASPVTVNNFVFLAREKFYDGLVFHRVEPGFVIQTGDPDGDGTGGPGYTIADESNALRHELGALGMAKGQTPNSAGSQFYVTLAPQPSLDGRYTVFGKVTSGMEVASKITKGDVMTSVTITER
ncbi:MAG: peptidylprolyl isomerase [Deltaproteobacteria bacterium]|nr:peptidylprolyl isomerase [Deltaproteobacteria bacterium]